MCDQTWSALSAEYGSTGYGCQSCLWSAEQGKMIFSLSPFTPENLVSRDGFSRPVPREPAYSSHSAESGAYSRNFSRFRRRPPFTYTANRHRVSPKFYKVKQMRTDGVQCRNAAGAGPVVLKAVRVTSAVFSGLIMDQLLFIIHTECSSH